MSLISVRRFQDCVGVFIGNNRPVYVTPSEATKLAEALLTQADDIAHIEYTRSSVPTKYIALTDTGVNGTYYVQKR